MEIVRGGEAGHSAGRGSLPLNPTTICADAPPRTPSEGGASADEAQAIQVRAGSGINPPPPASDTPPPLIAEPLICESCRREPARRLWQSFALCVGCWNGGVGPYFIEVQV